MVSETTSLHDDLFVMDGLSSSTLTKEYVTEVLPNAGVNAIHSSIIRAGRNFRDTIDAMLSVQAKLEMWPDVMQARTVEELEHPDSLGILFGLQDTTPLEDSLEKVRIFKQLGIGVIQLTYNPRNLSGNGATERVDGGISNFGVDVIEAIEAQNIVLDLSHAGHQTAADALEIANNPVIFSHSNPRAVHDHPRNITDDLAKAAAETGGTIGINAYPDFVGGDPTLDDLIDHVEDLCDRIGSEHVALGLDFIDNRATEEPEKLGHLIANSQYSNPPYTYPQGIESAADIPNITKQLSERGFSDRDIERIMGRNLIRVLRSVIG